MSGDWKKRPEIRRAPENLELVVRRQTRPDDPDEIERLPITWALVKRMLAYTAAYPARRTGLFIACALRAVQLTVVPWAVGRIIAGPVAHHDAHGLAMWLVGIACFLVVSEYTLWQRVRLAHRLGELAVADHQPIDATARSSAA